jgi:hypothetical protein
MIERLTEIINQRFANWSFVGSIVDWHYFDGQVVIKDFDIITSDQFEPTHICPTLGPRTSFRALGHTVDVFQEEPTEAKIPTIEQRITKLEWLITTHPHRREKCEELIRKYQQLRAGTLGAKPAKKTSSVPVATCPHRGPQLRTITSAICSKKTIDLPVYACGLYGGECVHRQVCSNHDPAIRICVGCPGRA